MPSDIKMCLIAFLYCYSGLGAPISSEHLHRALSPVCELNFHAAYRELSDTRTFSPLQDVDAPPAGIDRANAILNGMQALIRALVVFSSANHRCQLLTAGKIGYAAARLRELNTTHTRGTGAGERPQLVMNGVDVGSVMRRAGEAIRGQRFRQAGVSVALAFVASAGDVDDEPRALDHETGSGTWTTMDPFGRIKGEDELFEHWKQKHDRRVRHLLDVEKRLAIGRAPDLPAAPTAGDADPDVSLCCCCWAKLALDTEAGVRGRGNLY